MFVTKTAIPRRTVLRGMGVTLALPMLDAMVPALSGAAPVKAPPRFGFFYMPNGVSMNHTGVDYWKPKQVGANFECSPILKPLEPFRDQLTVISGMHHRSAESLGDGNGDHTRSTGTWLTGTKIKRTEGSDLRAGISVDQLIAAKIGQDTALPSLEMAILPDGLLNGGCDTGYSCAYGTTLAWASPSTPLPSQVSPRLVFEQLFGDGGPASQQRMALRMKNSILDSATEEMTRLQAKLGPSDKAVVDDYLTVLREVERRIQRAEANNAESPLPEYSRPGIGVPERFDDHVKLMFDLTALAYQGDITRVSTFMYGGEQRARMYPEMGFTENHHSMSHHGNNPENMERYAKLCTWEAELFSYLVTRLKSTPDGDGSLLDHSMLMFGGGMSDANIHSHIDLPTALVGGGAGIKGNRHIATPMGTPLSNLLLKIVNAADVPITAFGDSSGVLEL